MSSPSSSSSHPDCVLLTTNAYLGQLRNTTTASCTTRNHEKIEVSLFLARPPLPSNLYVHCPDLTLPVRPRIIRAMNDLFLLCLEFDCMPESDGSYDEYDGRYDDPDYFVYRAGNRPSLQRLPPPDPLLLDAEVGLLHRDAHYTVAALLFTGTDYDLYTFHSENPTDWMYRRVSVTEPQRRYPLLVPQKFARLLYYHEMSTVLSIGGEGGTMAWVDLWYGILLCDVLRDNPTLRVVPLPVPLELMSCNRGQGTQLGCPTPLRGIAFVDDCLKLVQLEANATLVPGNDFQMHEWTIVTYTNTAMTSNWQDWHMDCRISAKDITIDPHIKSQLLQSGLLGSSTSGQSLQNLMVSHPTLDISSAQGVVYLMARKKYKHPNVWVIAVDTRNKTLLGVAEFATENEHSASPIYCPSGIGKYIKPDIGLARCEKHFEKNPQVIAGMEDSLQGGQFGDADELVFFPGKNDPGAVTTSIKLMALTSTGAKGDESSGQGPSGDCML